MLPSILAIRTSFGGREASALISSAPITLPSRTPTLTFSSLFSFANSQTIFATATGSSGETAIAVFFSREVVQEGS